MKGTFRVTEFVNMKVVLSPLCDYTTLHASSQMLK